MKKVFTLLISVAFLIAGMQTATAQTTLEVPGTYATIQDAINAAETGDIVNVGSGTYTPSATINVDEDVTITGQGVSTVLQTSGGSQLFNISAVGATIENLKIEKTDKVNQNIIYIGASNVTIQDNTIIGLFVMGDGQVERGFEIAGGLTGLLIDGNIISSLRQPAYINNGVQGTVSNNFTSITKGWVVVTDCNISFTGNSWGTSSDVNYYDIALINQSSSINNYPDIVTVSANNNDAIIENQHTSYPSFILSIVHVDASVTSGNGSILEPYKTIMEALPRVAEGGKILVASGTYNENVLLNKSVTVQGAGPANTILTPIAGAEGTGIGVTISADNAKLKDLKITNFLHGITVSAATNNEINNVESVSNSGRGLELSTGTVDLSVLNSKLNNNNEVGFRKGTTAVVSGFTMDNCEVKGNNKGCNVFKNNGTGGTFDNVSITNSDFSDNLQKGMYFEALSNAIFDGITMDNSGTDPNDGNNNGININLKYGSYSNITIMNSSITNCGALGTAALLEHPAAVAITARDDGGYAGNPATLDNVIVMNNTIYGPRNGIRFGESGKTNLTPTNVSVTGNDLSWAFANKAFVNKTSASDMANCNWWGTTVESAIAAKIDGTVTFAPFSVSEGGACLGGIPASTRVAIIGTPTPSDCGTLDVPVTVMNFDDVGTISLKLNYNSNDLDYTGVTLNSAITDAALNDASGEFTLGYFGGAAIDLAGQPLFTLHFSLKPTATGGTTTNFTWNTTNSEYCEFAGPNGVPVYAGMFNDLSATIPERPVINTDTGLEYCTIQAAISDPLTLDTHTITVAAGTYPEQVTINKSIHLVGAVGAVIEAPLTLPIASDPLSNIVLVTGSGVSAEITGFTIQGPGSTACGSMGRGIFVRDGAFANIHHNQILDIRDNVFSGCQNGIAIQVGRNALSTSGSATIDYNTITGYQKGAIVVDNTGSDATITGNIITGAGTTTVTAQNGIQISRGATATINGNTVSGNSFHIEGNTYDYAGSGILLYESGAVSLTGGNNLFGNDQNYYASNVTGALVLGAEIFGASTAPVTKGYYIIDYTNQNIDASSCTFDGVSPGASLLANLFDIEDRIWHNVDDPSMTGFVKVEAGNVYVTDTDTDTDAHIQYGIDAAVALDIVNVKAGTYDENITVDKDVTLLGANAGIACDGRSTESTVAGTGGATVTVASDGVTIDGFEITNPNGTAITSTGRNDLLIEYNNINDIGTSVSGQNVHTIAIVMGTSTTDNVVISNNCISNISNASNNKTASGVGVGWSDATSDITKLVIASNTISNVTTGRGTYGIMINIGAYASGEAPDLSIANNTITGLTGAWSHGIGLEGNTPGASVTMNVVSDLNSGIDEVGVKVEDNTGAESVAINRNSLTDMNYGIVNTMVNLTVDATCNWYGSADYNDVFPMIPIVPTITGDVTFVNYLTSSNLVTASCDGVVPPVFNATKIKYYNTIQAAVIDANASGGNDIQVSAGTYFEAGQIVIDKDMEITGVDETTTIVKPDYTATGGYATTSGWFYVEPGITFGLSNVTLDGTDLLGNQQTIQMAIQSRGELTVEHCIVQNIMSAQYDGRGIVTLGGTANLINDVSMSNIQRIGIHIRGGAVSGLANPFTTIKNFTYTGKGLDTVLDYGIEFGGGGQGVVGDLAVPGSGATITNCLGVADDAAESASAAILVTDLYGTFTIAELYSSILTGNSNGLLVGYNEVDVSKLTATNNKIFGNTNYGIVALENTTVDATENWWGDASGPLNDPKNLCGLGNEVTSYVDFYPWWTDEAMTSLYVLADLVELGGPVEITSNVECVDAAGLPVLPVVNDHCGNVITPAAPVITNNNVDCNGSRTYEYTYIDPLGGGSLLWTYTYNIDRVTPPSEDGTAVATSGGTVECVSAATAPTILPVVKDVCGNTLDPIGVPTVGGSYAGCEGTYSYTYNYVDCSGLPYSWTYSYTIDLTTPPVVSANGGSTVECISEVVEPVVHQVDQQQTQVAANPNWDQHTAIGQSIKCGTSGYLTTIDLLIGSIVGTHNFTLKIYEGHGIEGELLYSEPHSISVTGWQSLRLDSETVPYLTSGNTYTFWLTSFTYNTLGVFCMYPDVYSDGTAMDGCVVEGGVTVGGIHYDSYEWQDWPAYDLVFKTYMSTSPATIPEVTDNCGNTLTPEPKEGSPFEAIDDCEGTITYTYVYTDCALNSTEWNYVYTIDDTQDPTITAPQNVIVNMNDGCTATGVDLGTPVVSDNCTALGDLVVGNNAPTAFAAGDNTVTWTVTDCAGNSKTATQIVHVDYNTLNGTVMYNNAAQSPMEDVTLKLTPGNLTLTTGDDGNYLFENLCAGTYSIEVVSNGNDVGGINSTDAGAANYWSTAVGTIQYVNFLAGDVNSDSYIASPDPLMIQSYFVFGNTEANQMPFVRGPWSYWQSGITIEKNADSKPSDFDVSVSGGDVDNYDLLAMCTGDFNGSLTADRLKSASSELALNIANELNVKENQEFDLPLRAQSAMEVGAVSMILDIPSNLVQVTDVKVIGSDVPVTWVIKGDELRIGWYSSNPVNVSENGNLVTLKLKTTDAFTMGQSLDLNLVYNSLNELADGKFEVIQNAKLLAAKVGNGLVSIADDIGNNGLLFSNYPNPFNRATTLEYTIPVDGRVNINVYNQLGQLVTTVMDVHQNAGRYLINDCGTNLVPGVYIAKLRLTNSTDDMISTIKLKVLK